MKKLNTKDNKKNIQLAVVVVMLFTTFFLIYSHFIKPNEADTSIPASISVGSDIQVADLAGLTPVVSPQEILKELDKFGDWPVTLGVLGRSNPFLPL